MKLAIKKERRGGDATVTIQHDTERPIKLRLDANKLASLISLLEQVKNADAMDLALEVSQ